MPRFTIKSGHSVFKTDEQKRYGSGHEGGPIVELTEHEAAGISHMLVRVGDNPEPPKDPEGDGQTPVNPDPPGDPETDSGQPPVNPEPPEDPETDSGQILADLLAGDIVEKLARGGLATIKDVREADDEAILAIDGIGQGTLQKIRQAVAE